MDQYRDSESFPAQYATTSPPSNVAFTLPVSIYGTFQHNWHMPQLATWNLNLEHQFSQSLVARVSYAGNKGTYLASGVLGFNEQNPAVYVPGNSTEANTQQRRLNPLFGSVGLFSSDNNSHYNSFRINVEKRLSHGVSILANYTRSRMIDDLSANGANGRTHPFFRGFDTDSRTMMFRMCSTSRVLADPGGAAARARIEAGQRLGTDGDHKLEIRFPLFGFQQCG